MDFDNAKGFAHRLMRSVMQVEPEHRSEVLPRTPRLMLPPPIMQTAHEIDAVFEMVEEQPFRSSVLDMPNRDGFIRVKRDCSQLDYDHLPVVDHDYGDDVPER